MPVVYATFLKSKPALLVPSSWNVKPFGPRVSLPAIFCRSLLRTSVKRPSVTRYWPENWLVLPLLLTTHENVPLPFKLNSIVTLFGSVARKLPMCSGVAAEAATGCAEAATGCAEGCGVVDGVVAAVGWEAARDARAASADVSASTADVVAVVCEDGCDGAVDAVPVGCGAAEVCNATCARGRGRTAATVDAVETGGATAAGCDV